MFPDVLPAGRIASILGLLLLYMGLTFANAYTKAPWEDESWFGVATHNLMTTHALTNDVLDGTGTWREGMKHHFYWQPPLSFVTTAIVCKSSVLVFSP